MKKKLHSILTAVAMLAAGMPAILTTAAAESVTAAFPKDTVLALYIRNGEEFSRKWDASPLGKAWSDEGIQAFFAPLLKGDDGLAVWDRELKEVFGVTVKEVADVFQGETILGMQNIPDKLWGALADAADEEPAIGELAEFFPPMVFVGRIGENRAKLDELIARVEKHEGAEEEEDEDVKLVNKEEQFLGETLHLKIVESAEDGALGAGWAVIDDIAIFAMPVQALRETVSRLKQADGAGSLRDSFFGKFDKASGSYDLVIYGKIEAVYPSFAKLVTDGMGGGNDKAAEQLGLSLDGVLNALGLDTFKAFAYGMQLGEDVTEMDSILYYDRENTKGLAGLLAFGEGNAPLASWIPEDVLAVNAMRYDLGGFWKGLWDIMNAVSPQVTALVKMQLTSMEQKLKVSIENDIIANIGDEIVIIQDFGEGEGGKSLQELNMLFSFRLKDAQAFGGGFNSLMATAKDAGIKFEKKDYLGTEMHWTAFPDDEGEMTRQLAYATAGDLFFLGIGDGGLIEKILGNLKNPASPLWERADVKRALAAFDPGFFAVEYSNFGAMIHGMCKDLADIQELGVTGETGFCDPDALPSLKQLEKALGITLSVSYLTDDGAVSNVHLRPSVAE